MLHSLEFHEKIAHPDSKHIFDGIACLKRSERLAILYELS